MVGPSKILKVGDRATVPWGPEELDGRVVAVWGEPATHVRVELDLGEGEEPEVLLLNPGIVRRAA